MGSSASRCRCGMLCARADMEADRPCCAVLWPSVLHLLSTSLLPHGSRAVWRASALSLRSAMWPSSGQEGRPGGMGTRLPENLWQVTDWGFIWVAWWAWDTACGLSTLQPFPARWVMTSQVFPANAELSSKAMGSIGPLEGHEAFEPPSCLHASYPPAPGEDPGGTTGCLSYPVSLGPQGETTDKL